MKFLHLSDLHLGKRVNEFSMLEDQAHILTEILRIADEERPDGVLIAGDVYDKSVPPTEAVSLFDDFLCRLAKRGLQVFVISGNHDSAERIAFGGRLMDASGIHLSPVYDGAVRPISIGMVDVYMLPFLKAAHVRRFYPEEKIDTYTDAMRVAVAHMPLQPDRVNLLVAHQFVTGAERSDSEELSVGGADNVDVSAFAPFDYVALGHLHGPQSLDSGRIRYCGTPLKYSFSEAKHQKSVTVLDIHGKEQISIRTVPLVPLHDLRELRGTYMDLTARRNYADTPTDDYLHITLTDEEDIPDGMGKLRVIYPNLMKLDYDNQRTRAHRHIDGAQAVENKSELELFDELFQLQNNRPMSDEQRTLTKALIERMREAKA